MKRALLSLAIVVAWGCRPPTLADQYLAEMEEIGNTGSTVIQVQEAESYALVVGGRSGSEDVSVTPYKRSGSGWERNPMGGISCSGPSAMLGFGDGYVYCGLITPDRPYTNVSVAGNQATIVDLPSGNRVWFVYSTVQSDPERVG